MAKVKRPAHPRKLTRAQEYEAVLAAHCRSAGKSFAMRALPNTGTAARLGLIASRKVARRAVDRNRAKRLAREVFRATRATLPAMDIVLQLRNDLRDMPNGVVRVELQRLLSYTARCK